jgi:hypothetical protein
VVRGSRDADGPAPPIRQAIHGITTGRPQGVIDTLHLVEVARAIEVLDVSPALSLDESEAYAGGSATTCAG